MATISATISNTAGSVDFNKEVDGILHDTTRANGRELKLAVAIYSAPEHFNIPDLLSVAKVDSKAKADRQRIALAKYSDAFARQVSEVKRLSDIAKNKAAKTDARMKAEIDVAPIKAALNATVSMFDRALVSAYYMRHTTSIVSSMAKDGKSVTLSYPKPFKRGEGDKAVDISGSEILSRGDIHAHGKALAVSKGILSAPKTSKSGAGAAVSTGTQATVLSTAKLLADTVAAMPKKDKDEATASVEFPAAWASMTRALFNGNGEVKMSEIYEAIRKSDAFKGCAIVNDLAPARNAPAKKSA